MIRSLLISLAALLALATAGQALSPPPGPCELADDPGGDLISWTSNDLQPGAALSLMTDPQSEAYRFVLEDCRSGRMLRVELTDPQSINWTEHGGPIQDAFYDAVRSDKTYTFKDLRRAFRKAGYKTTLSTSSRESCGCNHFYPALRGSKTPYEAN